MLNNLELNHINFILVFLEGIISFLSPCILPLIPIYISYLAGGTKNITEDGTIIYNKKTVFLHTICFIFGICATFFILGLSFSFVGQFFNKYQTIFTRISAIIIILLGLFQLGIFKLSFLQQEKKLNFEISDKNINPLVAFVMGFTFSFGWTPCVGPSLSSVLILASSSKDAVLGNILIVLYSLGFVIPFILLGLFTTSVLNFFNKNQKLINYTVKLSGIILIIIGVITMVGSFNKKSKKPTQNKETTTEAVTEQTTEQTEDNTIIDKNPPAYDFTLKDQYGNEHTLSDYKGKVVFLNFWATWCNPCKIEMPHIENIYKEYGLNKEEVVILGVANPKSEEYPFNNDEPKEKILQFIEENGYTFPILFDETGEVFYNYYINSFPTTYMIDKEGRIFGYIQGALPKETMINIIEQTLNASTEEK